MSIGLDENLIIKAIAERIKTERIIRRISQEDLAAKAGMTQSKVSKLECSGKGGGIYCGIGTIVDIAKALNCSYEYLLTGMEAGDMNSFIERFSMKSSLTEVDNKSKLYSRYEADNAGNFIGGFDPNNTLSISNDKDEFYSILESAKLNNNCTICVGTKLIIGVFNNELITCFDENRSIPASEHIEPVLLEACVSVYNEREMIAVYRCFTLSLGHLVLSLDGEVASYVGGELDSDDENSWRLYNIAKVIAKWINKNKHLVEYIGEEFGDMEYPCILTTAAYVRPAYRELGLFKIMRNAICEALSGRMFFLVEEPCTENWFEVANILPCPLPEILNDNGDTKDIRDSFSETLEEGNKGTCHVVLHGENIYSRINRNRKIAKKIGMSEIRSNEAYFLNESLPVYCNAGSGKMEAVHYMYYKIPKTLQKGAEDKPSEGLIEETKELLKDLLSEEDDG